VHLLVSIVFLFELPVLDLCLLLWVHEVDLVLVFFDLLGLFDLCHLFEVDWNFSVQLLTELFQLVVIQDG